MREIKFLFLKLGFTAFGGPAAHIAMMKTEVVARRRWMTETQFLDLLGAVNLIPGPNSTELAIHIGFMRGGWAGLLLAGICFILPAALVVFGCAWAYVRFGSLPETAAVLYGIKPVIIAIVLEAIWGLGKAALESRFLAVIGATSLTLALLGINELLLLFGAGALAGIRKWSWRGVGKKRHLVHPADPAICSGDRGSGFNCGDAPRRSASRQPSPCIQHVITLSLLREGRRGTSAAAMYCWHSFAMGS